MPAASFKARAEDAKLLQLVATYCGVEAAVAVADVSEVEFTLDGQAGFGANTACRAIAAASPPLAAQLLGQTPEQQAKVRGGCARRRFLCCQLTTLHSGAEAGRASWSGVGWVFRQGSAAPPLPSAHKREERPSTRPSFQVAEWLAYRHTELSPLMDDKLAKVRGHQEAPCRLQPSP